MRPRTRLPAGRQGPGPMPSAAVAALDLALVRRTGGRLPGEYRGIGVGIGTELAQLRPYQVGDDVRQIDPAASARTGVPHVRQHVPERALTTWSCVDLSPSMAFGSEGRLKSDVAEGVAKVVARMGVRRGGHLGFVAAGVESLLVLPPRGGRQALAGDRHALAWGRRRRRPRAARSRRRADARARARAAAGPRRRGLRLPRRGSLAARPAQPRRRRSAGDRGRDPRPARARAAGLWRARTRRPRDGRHVEADTSSSRLRDAFAKREATRRERVAGALRRSGVRHAVVRTDRDWLRDFGKAIA